MNELILYTTDDGRSQIKLRAQEQTVWLTPLEMAATIKESLTVRAGSDQHPTTEKSSVVQKEQL